MKSLILFLLIVFSLSSVFSQIPTPTPADDTIRISTTLIQVDVTVTDKKGNAVPDLKPEDFEVFENGKKQTLTNFSFVSVNKLPENSNSNSAKINKNTIPLPPVKLKTEEVRRTYALVVDDLGLNFGNIYWVRQSLKKFINEQVLEGDLVAIIRTGSGIGALQSFTSDKRQLLAAIDKIKWNSYGRGGTSTFAPIETTLREDLNGRVRSNGTVRNVQGTEEEKEFLKQAEEIRNQNFSVGTLGAINYVIRGMRDLPGRKAIVLFSEGFSLSSDGAPTRVFDEMRILADAANRSSVVFYTLDPRGLQNPLMASADEDIRNIIPTPGAGRMDSDPRDARTTAFRESQMSLNYLAYQTGGTAFINQNNLDMGLRKAVDDQSNYYLLGYQPDEATFDPKKNKFNKLEVRVKRKNINVRYRSGFFAITDEKLRSLSQTPKQKITQALISPFNATDINLSLYPIFQNDAAGGDLIQALVHIDAKDVKFTEANGNRKANFDLIAMTFGDNGMQIDQLSKNYTVEVSEKVYQNMLAKGFVYTLTVPIKKSGAYQFRVALRDTASDKVGSASQFIEVPDVKKRLSLSNLVLDNFTAEEWQKIKQGATRDDSEKSVLLDTTLRQFKRGTVLRYDYVVYLPKAGQPTEMQLRLIKDGKIIYEEKPAALKTDGQSDLTRIQTAGAVSLGKNLETGTYILQVIAVDSLQPKKFAAQFVEFEIVE